MCTCTGTAKLLSTHGTVAATIDETQEVEEMTTCNKDTGSKRRVQKWTRGVWFCVSGGGHIQMWQPLYQYDCLHNSIIMHEFWMHCLII